MRTRLKQHRVAASMTQVEVATEVGVKQPTYQRWESGAVSIPQAKINKLAEVLETDPQALLGKHPPIEAGFYNREISPDLNYYGEVAIHFIGGGAPLLLSISDGAFSDLNWKLQTDCPFVQVQSMANQTVMIRTEAIADLYFSSEAYDDYGPDHIIVRKEHLSIQMPDPRDWAIVEALATQDDYTLGDFEPADVKRVQSRIMLTDDEYREIITEGLVELRDFGESIARDDKKRKRIFGAATDTTYQLSTGQQRSTFVDLDRDLFDALWNLCDEDMSDFSGEMIRLPAEGWHRTIFINKNAIDYIVVPSHKYKEGELESAASELDEYIKDPADNERTLEAK